jgi:FixJ family two-component response regulator
LRRTIFIVDDEEIVRVALTRLLQAEGYAVQSYASASAFLESYAGCEEGCVISDLAMPGLSGLDLQSALAATAWPLPVIFISGYGTVPASVQAMKQGAVDFLTKPVKDVDLLRAIRSAIEKDRQARAIAEPVEETRRRLASLTPRELEVLKYVCQGQLNKQIAADLGIVEKTIKVHRARVMEKMGVRSVAELVRQCERLEISASNASSKAPRD